jgi:hypothetical protein
MKSVILQPHEAACLAEAGRVTIWRPVLPVPELIIKGILSHISLVEFTEAKP